MIVELLGRGLEHPNGYGQFFGIRAVERDRPDAGQRIGQTFPELHPGLGELEHALALVFEAAAGL